MALSGSTNLSSSRSEIISRALRLIGGIPTGGTPSSDQTSEAAIALEHMAKAWMADGLPLWKMTNTSFNLTASTASYTIGLSQTVNTDKPLRIVQAWLRDTDSVDVPLRIITADEYYRLGNKTSTGTPSQLYYDVGRATGTIYVYPTPDSTAATEYDVYIRYQKPFDDFDATGNEPDFPQEWFEALSYGLAARLAPEYGITMEERAVLWKEANFLKEQALSMGTEEGSLYFSPDWRGY